MSDKVYNIIKWVSITFLPALNVMLGIVLPACGVSAETTTTIITIIAAVDTFIGTLAGVSSVQYAKGKTEGK